MCGSIVLVEYDDAGVGERFFEFKNVSYVGTAKCVYGLVAVADYENVSVFVSQFENNVILGGVGVLVFIYEDMLEPFLVVLEGLGVIVEEFDGDGEEIIEIHGACCAEASLIFVVNLCNFSIENSVSPLECCVSAVSCTHLTLPTILRV